jgi:fructose-1-phosphate kinase PfkB-like protein
MRVWCFTPNPVQERKLVVGAGRVEVAAGGKGRNVARQLRAWGIPAISKTIFDALASGSDAGSDPRERVGWALVREWEERIDFFTMDPEINLTDWTRIGKHWRQVLRKGDWWVVAGSSATGWPKGWWRKLIGDLQKRGVSVLVDSRGALLREAVEAGADWIKCNLAEAEETTGLKGVERCIRSLKGNGTTGVVVTLGKDGLAADVNGEQIFVSAPRVRVFDPTGSGDVVTATILYGELQKWTMERTLRTAVKAGAWNTKGEGNVAEAILRG